MQPGSAAVVRQVIRESSAQSAVLPDRFPAGPAAAEHLIKESSVRNVVVRNRDVFFEKHDRNEPNKPVDIFHFGEYNQAWITCREKEVQSMGRVNRMLFQMLCLGIIFMMIAVLVGKAGGFLSSALGTGAAQERVEVIRSGRRSMEMPRYFFLDDEANSDDSDCYQDSEKRKMRVRLGNHSFLDSLFHTILYPLLLFFIIIRLFGKNLRVPLWQIISYIHVRDDGEYYLLPGVCYADTGI